MTDPDALYMSRALALAGRGRGLTSPNPMVGAVVVAGGEIAGEGYHARAGGPHAEIEALRQAGGRARGATLYCTLEPCCHVGRTGPCVERILAAGVARVVAPMTDPDPRVSGRGFAYLREHGVTVTIGVGVREARRLNRAFLRYATDGRPFVTMKVAVSADWRIARAPGVRTLITSSAAQAHAHAVRAEVDAIGVGSNTVLVDDPLLTVRTVDRVRPLTRVVFDRRLRTPPTARLLSTLDHGPVIILTEAAAMDVARDRARRLREAGARVQAVDAPTLGRCLHALAASDTMSLILEGGARMHEAAWKGGLVDRVHLYQSPEHLGPSGVAWLTGDVTAGLEDVTVQRLGPDTFTEGYVHRVD